VILSIGWLALGFELIEPIIRINPIILAALGAPLIYNGSITITDSFIFPNNKIVYGPCPVCETETRVYFGDILGVQVSFLLAPCLPTSKNISHSSEKFVHASIVITTKLGIRRW
jgi:hypothetical protein